MSPVCGDIRGGASLEGGREIGDCTALIIGARQRVCTQTELPRARLPPAPYGPVSFTI